MKSEISNLQLAATEPPAYGSTETPPPSIHPSNNPPTQPPAAPSIRLKFLSDAAILHRVDRGLLTRFLEGFESGLSPEAAQRLRTPCPFDEWCSFWAAWFKAKTALPPILLATLLNIETLAQPENAVILEQAIAQLPPEFEIKRHSHPVCQALHLWLIAQHHPEAPWPLVGDDVRSLPIPEVSSAHQSNIPIIHQSNASEPVGDDVRSLSPSFSSLPSVQTPPDCQISDFKSEIAAAPEPPASLPSDHSETSISKPDIVGDDVRSLPPVSPSNPPPPPPIQQSTNPSIQPAPGADFERLASLSPIDYDHVRKAEAKRLGIRLATLDDEVDRCRAQQDDAEAAKVMLPVPEPWPEPITDAPALFDAVRARFPHYVYLPAGADILLTLFLGHVHAFPAFHYSPRLNLISTKEECGKSTVVAVFASMATKTLRVHSLKPAVVYRVAEQRQPTLCLDEVENYLPLYRELLALLNAGNSADACAPRCEGKTVRFYKAFTPVILSGIGDLCRTLRSRSILIPMTEAPEGAGVTRFNPENLALETELARKLARWAADHLKPIAACDPPLPRGARNRLADNWRPLFQIAHTLGAHWPDLAEQAFNALKTAKANNPTIQPSNNPAATGTPTHGNTETPPSPAPIRQSNNPSSPIPASQPSTLNHQLLSDLRQIFESSATDRLPSRYLVAALCSMQNRPWSWLQPGNRPITVSWLGRRLASLGIMPRNLRINGLQTKAYLLAELPCAPNNPRN